MASRRPIRQDQGHPQSRRVARVSRLLKEAIGKVLQGELSDPRIGFVTVVKVEPSSDLKSAKVYVSLLGLRPDQSRPVGIEGQTALSSVEGQSREGDEVSASRDSRTMHGLTSAAGFIRKSVARLVKMRRVPTLRFVRDESVKRSVRIGRIISESHAGPET